MKLEDMLYCPACGGSLSLAKWQHYTNPKIVTKICPQNHLWDVYLNGSRFEFTEGRLAQCQCGETMPEWELRQGGNKQRLCRKCFESKRQAWRMDAEKSFARLEITPVKSSGGASYHLQTSIEIHPYPNPFMFGGMYGGSRAKDEQELDQAIKEFDKTVDSLRQSGLTRVEVERHDEIVRTEQPTLVAVEASKPAKPKQMGLEL